MFLKKICSPLLLGAFMGLSMGLYAQEIPVLTSEPTLIQQAAKVIDAWHLAAADADFDQYFSLMTKRGVFVGTDATEHWENNAFKSFS
ncbi:MAG: nuclear transport factor 2 family protein, partial [Flavobacteriaceae bacterium]|nr:nuclear transport factor 2 family protein [Flavobacteriaceae bacterium]